MRKILFTLLLCLFGICSANADVITLRTHALKVHDGYTWTKVDNGSGIQIVINTTTNVMSIFSSQYQEFSMYNFSDWHYNKYSHKQLNFDAIDLYGGRCGIRVIVRDDSEGPVQVYIHYNNIDYVYNCYFE